MPLNAKWNTYAIERTSGSKKSTVFAMKLMFASEETTFLHEKMCRPTSLKFESHNCSLSTLSVLNICLGPLPLTM